MSAPEELSAIEPMPASRDRNRDRDHDRARLAREPQPFGDSVWFSISIGRSRKAEPRWLLPMLCRAGNITAKVIGAIRIHETVSFVEIQAQSVEGFLASVGPQMQLESGVRLTRLDGPPDLSAVSIEPAPQQERPNRKPAQGFKPRAKAGPKPKWQARDTSADGDAGEKPKFKPKWQQKGARAEDPKPKRKLKKGGKQPPKFKGKPKKGKPREG